MNHILKCHEIVKTDFVRGDNCYLYDEEGKRYVDLESGIWCTALGHNNPRIKQVMVEQIEQIMHLGTRYPHVLAEKAAIDVLNVAGLDEGKCVFLSSGSEAVEFGVQAARRITGKQLLLTFSNSYLAAYGSAGRKATGEWWLFDWRTSEHLEIEEALAEIPFEEVGAFVFEPGGSGMGFVTFPPKELVLEIVRRVRQAGGLIIANEVTTGMGRTGKWFGFQHYDVQPDIVALGKGLGNGYPVSAVAMQGRLAGTLEESGFVYAQSHQNDPLGCAVAREVIAIMREENWIDRGALLGNQFLGGLMELEKACAVVKEARGRGMLLGLELHAHEDLTVRATYVALVESGFLAGYYPAGNMLRFSPALTIEEDDIKALLANLTTILGC